MKNVLMAFGLALTTLTSFAQSTAWSVIAGSENHTLLEAAISVSGLQDTLEGEGTFTVLAPTDAAFTILAEELEIPVEQLLELPNLTEILMYHVLPEVYLYEILLQSGVNSMHNTLLNEPIYFQSLATSVTVNGVASVTTSDIITDNGVVHVIDRVVLPPNGFGTCNAYFDVSQEENSLGVTITLYDYNPNATYTWDFGDESTPSNDPFPTYTYDTNGPHVLCLIVEDENCDFGGDTYCQTISVDSLGVLNGFIEGFTINVVDGDGSGPVTGVSEIQNTQRPLDNHYYNVMGQRFDNLRRIPFGTVYIFNGKQYIRTED